MQESFFSKEYSINYYEINKYQEAAPVTLLNYLEDTAISHSYAAGLGINKLKADGVAWILNGWYLVIERYPYLHEKVVVETWPSGFDRLYATREYRVKDAQGEILARATSQWIFINIDKKRPVRIPSEFGDAYGLNPKRALDYTFNKLEKPVAPEYSKEFLIRKSDIDTNNHVNNKRYVEWMIEAIPEHIYENCKLLSLEVSYQKEACYGSIVSSQCKSLTYDTTHDELSHLVYDKNNGLDLATGKTVWIPR